MPRAPTQDGPAVRLYLVDGSGFIFRAYHALPPLTRKSDGLPVGAVQGFCNMLWKLLVDMKAAPDAPTHLAVVFDHSEKTFRNDLYAAYKAHRPPAPEDLVPQFPLVREATRAFGVPCLELPGYEADDLIAAYACHVRDAGGEVVIVSSDKDLMQLVGERVSMLDTMKNLRIGHAEVFEKFGVTPDKVVDVQALCGDSVDNVPGAPGIGIKTASALINEYGDLDTLLARAGEIKQQKRRETLIDFADQIRLSRELVRLDCDTPLPAASDTLAVEPPEPATLAAFLEAMEFRTLARRVGDGAGVRPAPAPVPAAPAEAPKPIDTNAYVCVRDLATLDAWIARAREAGIVAFDTETDALSSANAGLCGVSLAVAPGEACYIPVGHCEADGLALEAAAALDQIPLDDVDRPPQADARGPVGPQGGAERQIRPRRPLALRHRRRADRGHHADLLCAGGRPAQPRHGRAVGPVAGPPADQLQTGGRDRQGAEELQAHRPGPGHLLRRRGRRRHPAPLRPAAARGWRARACSPSTRPWSGRCRRCWRRWNATACASIPSACASFPTTSPCAWPSSRSQAHGLAGRPFNLGSPKQIGDVLFGELGLDGGKKTATGVWSTDASVLEDLAAKGHPLPRVLLDWRQLSKLKGTYTEALVAAINERTGRVHTSYALAATTTGRLSSSDPNLQNIPIRTEEGRKIRQAFVAEPGNLLISADYSQIELRLLAHIGDIPQLKRAFLDGLDIHAMTASEMFGVPVEGMPAETRRRAKAINFGIIYGISAFGLSNQLGIPQDEAGAYIKTYFERFPGIRAYMDRTRALVREQGFVTTLFGRRINIPMIRSKSVGERQFAERAAINAPIQGAAADVMRRAMIRMPAALAKAGLSARMLLQVHDELVFEAPEAEVEATIAVARDVMQHAALPAVSFSVPLLVEARAAGNWDEAH